MITSIAVPKPLIPSASSPDCRTSDMPSKSNLWRHRRPLFLFRKDVFPEIVLTRHPSRVSSKIQKQEGVGIEMLFLVMTAEVGDQQQSLPASA
jgi:hypothetical protein